MRTRSFLRSLSMVVALSSGVVALAAAAPAGAAGTVGVTVAGGNGYGPAADQLASPYDVALDGSGNVYIADGGNHRVQRWAPGATSGVTVAGGHGTGTAADQLSYPQAVALDTSGNLYVADTFNNRVQRWAPGATSGVTVAGGNGRGAGANQLDLPIGVEVDALRNVAIADFGNHRVQRWAPGATSGLTVAGGNGPGGAADQLDGPSKLALDTSGNVYIADVGNHRVQRWAPGATSGATVAGGNGRGASANQLDSPRGVALDAQRNLYVSDGQNFRVQLWAPGTTGGVTVAGGNGQGSNADQFGGPQGIRVGVDGSIYVADGGAYRIQRWPAAATTVLPGSGVVAAPVSGTADLDVSVTLSAASSTAVTVPWTTLHVPGAPTSPLIGPQAPLSDYTPVSGVVTFAPGQGTAHVTIPVSGHSTGADYEYVLVSFHDPTGARMGGFWGLGFGLIESAQHAALPTVLPGTGRVAVPVPGTADLDVAVTLSAPSALPVSVPWTTVDAPGAPPIPDGGYQAPGTDYTPVSGVVTFAPGDTTAHVTIPVHLDHFVAAEYVLVSFHDPTGAKMGGSWGLGYGVINAVE